MSVLSSYFFFKEAFKKKILFIFRRRGRAEEGEGEKHRHERDTFIICILHAFNWGPGLQHSVYPDW